MQDANLEDQLEPDPAGKGTPMHPGLRYKDSETWVCLSGHTHADRAGGIACSERLRARLDMGPYLAGTPLDEIPPGEDAREARWEKLLQAREALNAMIRDEREHGGEAWAAFVARRAR